jgi:hypothetical protein
MLVGNVNSSSKVQLLAKQIFTVLNHPSQLAARMSPWIQT